MLLTHAAFADEPRIAQWARKRGLLNVVGMREERTHRATAARRRGNARADAIARRVGIGLKEARLAQRLRQADVALEAGITQPYYSRIERGLEAGATLLLAREVLTADEFPPIRPTAPRRAAAQ